MFSLLKSTTGAPRPRSSDTSPSHHGRAVAAILLESVFDAATSSAAHQPRYHNFSSHHRTPRLQPHRHLRPTHSRTSYTSRPPLQPICDSTVHTAIAAYTPTPGTHLTAGVSTSATATPANGRTRYSTTIDFPTQPTATTHHTWQHSACPTAPTHPIPHTTCSRLLEPNRATLESACTATNYIVQFNPPSGLEKQEWPASPPLRFSRGNWLTTVPPSSPPVP